MAKSTGLVAAAAGIALANEAIFVPMETHQNPLQTINWRILPAAAVLALVLAGLEKVSEPLGAGLAGLTLLAVLIVPIGNAPTPLENAGKIFGGIGGK